MADLRKILIDGQEVEADASETLIQVCDRIGVEIPRFCYHERLSIAGNCRMCLVEIVGGPPKPAAACAMQVRDLRPGKDGAPPQVLTTTPMVRKAREGALEFLLINHPLDCPICDQGGECDLQDQSVAYGVEFSRFREAKRAVVDLDLGPLVETHMTRCIHCTRCVRFMTEVAGVPEMGTSARGEDMRIVTWGNEIEAEGDDPVSAALRASLSSNMQANIIDLCPVGALVNKPYSFTARPWELTKTESIDVMDAMSSSIRVDTKGREVMRILPRNHDGVNEEWISDKTRFVWDGLRRQRLDRPYVRENGKLRPADWPEALSAAASAIRDRKLAALVGDLVPVEAAFALGHLARAQGGVVECRTDGAKLPAGNRSAYVGTARIEELDDAKWFVLIGTNPRDEAPVLNARIRKAWTHGARVRVVGPEGLDLTYDYTHAGSDRAALSALVEEAAAHGPEADAGIVIVGQDVLCDTDGEAVLAAAMRLCEVSGGKLMVLHTAAGRVGAMDAGATTEGGIAAALGGAEVVYALGVDEIDIPPGPLVIYQGSHGDRGAHRADVILPAAAWTEENGLFVNTEGRPQLAFRAAFPPGEARENWAILRALSAELGAAQPWDTLAALRQALVEAVPHLAEIDAVPENEWQPLAQAPLAQGAIGAFAGDFYLTNPIARASALMAELSRNRMLRDESALAAE